MIRYKAYGHEYIEDLIRKSVGNDFMAWEKANKHYKKECRDDVRNQSNRQGM